MKVNATTMSFALVFRSLTPTACAFTARTLTRTATRMQASALDDLVGGLTKAFSTSSTSTYTVGITGASGLLGTALIDELGKQETIGGKQIQIVKLERQATTQSNAPPEDGNTSITWNPYATTSEEVLDKEALSAMDAVIHLAGENVATGLGPLGFLGIRPWTAEKKAEILQSRVGPTEGLAKAIASCKTPTTFLAASGVGVYGSDFIGEEAPTADEDTDTTSTMGFLAEVSRKWEKAAQAAGKNRVVNCRLGVILSKNGGALAKLWPIFFLGGGGNVGSGEQYFTFISARDAARALVHILATPSLKGPVNVCSPTACTNAQFTKALGGVLSRPTILPLPGFVVSLMFGEMGEEMLLGGVRAAPGKLAMSGFEFQHSTIEEALQSALDETI